jgi:hypothetical protein
LFLTPVPSRFTSYINNLHPHKYKKLYSIIEDVITAAIPLWNMTLTPQKAWNLDYYQERARIEYDSVEYDQDPDQMPEDQIPQQQDNEGEEDYWERRNQWADGVRRIKLPEPEEFTPPPVPEAKSTVDLKRDYSHRGLQIIVKLANIELTPEKPEYEGGTWHVEGQLVCHPYPSFEKHSSHLLKATIERTHLLHRPLLLRHRKHNPEPPRLPPTIQHL